LTAESAKEYGIIDEVIKDKNVSLFENQGCVILISESDNFKRNYRSGNAANKTCAPA